MTTEDFIRENIHADVRSLALKGAPAGVDMLLALRQIEGRQLARRKLPAWADTEGIVLPPRLALEQCSSEATAAYKVAILRRRMADGTLPSRPDRLVDLTGGMGVDFMAMAPCFAAATYVERNPELVEAARHNAPILVEGPAMTFVEGEAESHLTSMPTADVVFLDPARRDAAGRKVALIEDCQPDVCRLAPMLVAKSRLCIVKLSPMLDISAAMRALPRVAAAHVVSLDGECKELLVEMLGSASAMPGDTAPIPSPTIHCAIISTSGDTTSTTIFSFTPAEEAAAQADMADAVEEYVYEPDAALLKAGAFRIVGQRMGLRKLGANTHLYTSSRLKEDFPGRTWRVEAQSGFSRRELRLLLGDARSAELSVRGFPMSVAALRKKMHLADGGKVHLMATTLGGSKHVLLKVAPVTRREA